MNRRDLISGSAGLPLLGAAIFTAVAVRDPHNGWLEHWKALREAWQGAEVGGEEEKSLWRRASAIEHKLANTRPVTLDGAASQLEWVLESGERADFFPGHHEAIEGALKLLKREFL